MIKDWSLEIHPVNGNLRTALIKEDDKDEKTAEQEEEKKEIRTRVNDSNESDDHKSEHATNHNNQNVNDATIQLLINHFFLSCIKINKT